MRKTTTIAAIAIHGIMQAGCADLGEEGEDPELGTAELGEACRSSLVNVDLEPDSAGKVSVELCLPDGEEPSTVLLLLAGATYSKRYWDLEDPVGNTKRFSFVAAATGAGYATLAIDRIGIGASSRPDSSLVTMEQNVNITNQLVTALRDGDIEAPGADVRFAKVVLVGHSLGSLMAFLEATQFGDVDGVVVTGATHGLRAGAAELFFSQLHPAGEELRFRRLDDDPGYLTTIPGARDDLLYAPSTDFDPKVVAIDEITKQTVTAVEFAGALQALAAPLDVRAPVFILMGDPIFCSQAAGDGGSDCSSAAALVAQEAPLYGSQTPCVEASITPGAAHNLNAFFSATESFAAITDFLDAHIGAGESTPGC
jgi:pimeloyl-ACP methyl ester carboxylesterase